MTRPPRSRRHHTPAQKHGRGRVEVLVVGAGPTGLTVGCELARRGITVRVIDQAAGVARGTRGKGLQPRTLEAFHDLGIAARVLNGATPYPPMCHYQPDGATPAATVRMFPLGLATPTVPYPNTLLVPQSRTEQLLRDRLTDLGVQVEPGIRLTGWQQDGGTVTATLTGPRGVEQVDAQYLVGADGAHSTVRAHLGVVAFPGVSDPRDHSLLADVTATMGLDRELQHLWADPTDPAEQVWLCPLPDPPDHTPDRDRGRGWQLIVRSRHPLSDTWTVGDLQRLLDERTHRSDLQLDRLDWHSLYRGSSARTADQWRHGRVLLAGDAAHVVPPEGGQGLNLGVADGRNLAWKLAAVLQGAPESLLDTYQTERQPTAQAAAELSLRLHAQAVEGGPGSYRRPPATSQLAVSYREPFAVDRRESPGRVTAGDRAPDAPVAFPATGTDTRLFELFRGPHWVLLAVGHPSASSTLVEQVTQHYGWAVAAWAVTDPDHATDLAVGQSTHLLTDTGGHVRGGYGLAGREEVLLLVRPDGYLGWVGPPHDLDQLTSYLTGVTDIRGPATP